MTRGLLLAAVLALGACAREEPAAPPPAPVPSPVDLTPAAAQPARPASELSETEQAQRSQESGDSGEAAEHTEADTSLEQLAAAPAPPQSERWQPGVNYRVLVPAQPTSVPAGHVEVLEVFWLGCGHCYALEPLLQEWLRSKPAYVEFVRVPVIWQGPHRAHAQLYYTLRALGREDLIAAAFSAIAVEHQVLGGATPADTLRLQQQFAAAHGVSGPEFARAWSSAAVAAEMKHAEDLTQAYAVEAVPFVAVNGKYSSDLELAGGGSRLIGLINDLSAAEHAH